MNKLFFTLFALFLALTSLPAFAQDNPAMADAMRSNGKSYVVVTVCMIILIGLFIYLISVDRKISSIEKNKE